MQETGGNYIHECCQASNLQGRRTSEHFTSILGGSKQAGKEEKREKRGETHRGRGAEEGKVSKMFHLNHLK